MIRSTHNSALNRFAIFTAFATLALVGLGGLVTSHEAGMAVPDWPTTYGYNMFLFPISKWVGGIFYEHTHRLVAAAVGLLTSILALGIFGVKSRLLIRWSGGLLIIIGLLVSSQFPFKRVDGLLLVALGVVSFGCSFFWPRAQPSPASLRWLAIAAFIAVIMQGVLGGVRVIALKDQIGIFHATLAQLFLVLVSVIALLTSPAWQKLADFSPKGEVKNLQYLMLAGSVLIFGQLALGATMRHQHAGLAVPDFPLAHGKIWPPMDSAFLERFNQSRFDSRDFRPITAFHMTVHMAHRVGALLILIMVGYGAVRARWVLGRENPVTKLCRVWVGLILCQGVLGALTVLKNKPADIATAHVLLGALSLVVGSILTIICFSYARRADTALGIAYVPQMASAHSQWSRLSGFQS
jgi:heme a synthase